MHPTQTQCYQLTSRCLTLPCFPVSPCNKQQASHWYERISSPAAHHSSSKVRKTSSHGTQHPALTSRHQRRGKRRQWRWRQVATQLNRAKSKLFDERRTTRNKSRNIHLDCCIPICLSMCPLVDSYTSVFVHWSTCLSICLLVCLPVCPCASKRQSINQSVSLSVCLSIHLLSLVMSVCCLSLQHYVDMAFHTRWRSLAWTIVRTAEKYDGTR